MSEAPKILWVEYEEGCWPTVMEKKYEAGTKCIRADIVEEMREVLKWIAKEAENYYERTGKSITWLDDAKAALKLLEDQ